MSAKPQKCDGSEAQMCSGMRDASDAELIEHIHLSDCCTIHDGQYWMLPDVEGDLHWRSATRILRYCPFCGGELEK